MSQPHSVPLLAYDATWPASDPDANFREEVAYYSAIDPLPTLEGMSRSLNIPVGVIARYVLVRWATSGSVGIMEIGPRTIRQMSDTVREAESTGTDNARLKAYDKLTKIISWLEAPLKGG